ncbi:MAG: extracellular solute-binding protein [Oscillospiraceae bacterium]|nr:extracellular solute-binding protein [Oscillospiraceae bacterium]
MKNITKTLLALLLSLSLLLSLTLGCADNNKDNDSPPNDNSSNGGSSNGDNSNGDGSSDEYIYTAEIISLPHNIMNINNIIYSNDKIYFSSSEFNYQFRISTARIFTMNLDGSSLTEFFNTYQYQHNNDDTFVSSTIRVLCADTDGNIWIGEWQYLYRYNTPDGFDYDNDKDMDSIFEYREEISQTTYLKKLDASGEELISVDLNNLVNTNNIIITGAEHDSDGNIIIGTNTGVYIFNEEGSLLFNLIHDDITWIQGVITLSDETIAIFDLPGSETEVQQINIQDKTWGDCFSLLEDAYGAASGNGDNYFFCYNRSDLFGYNKAAEDFHVVLNWVESGALYRIIRDVTVLDDGRVLGVGNILSLLDNQDYEMFLLTKTLKPETTDEALLTLATFNPSRLITNAVIEFNNRNTKYEIQLIDYFEFATNDNWNAGLTKLYLEILSGNAPDIIDVTSLPFRHLANMGLFEDLYNLIDADEVLNRSDFFESVLKVGEHNNKLYRIFPSFSIFTTIGDATVLGAETGWTIDELMAVINANPQADMPLGNNASSFNLLYDFTMLSLNDFINWETGATYFDSDTFIRFLEFANSFTDEIDFYDESTHIPWSILSGRQIMARSTRISDLVNLQLIQTGFDSDLVFKGFPTEDRNGNAFNVDTALSISSVSEHKEGAWEFVRTMLMEDNRSLFITDFPTNKALFEKKLDIDLYTLQHNGLTTSFSGVTVEYNVPSQEEVDNLRTFINSIDKMIEYDDVLYKIITESAMDYFNGIRTVEEAARIIQNRASIYVSEQVG